MTPPKTQSVVKGAYREATANPLGFTGDLLSGAVQSAWDAISVPRRAMEGQPMTYGDIAGLTGMMTLGAGAGTAPAGALRMGAAREGRAPVTFDDAERAMQETPGIRAYHGTPHSFDKFEMSKIGTGEGAQAYGRGLYFAENEGVAQGYKQSIQRNSDELRNIAERDAGLSKDAAELLSYQFSMNNFHGSGFDKWLDGLKENLSKGWLSDRAKGAVEEIIAKEIDASDAVRKMKSPGSMYEVNINANPDDFINYDAPLSAQGQKVKEQFGYTPKPTPGEEIAAYELAKREAPNNIGEHPAVQDIYRRESAANAAERLFQSKVQGGGVDEAARIGLSQAGIPGIKYLDAGSRGAADVNELRGTVSMWTNAVNKTPNDDYAWKMLEDAEAALKKAEGGLSRNFVVFDENLISIVRKYGIAGAAVMLGTSADQISQTLTENMTQEELNNLVSGA
jgi:hypothetical protein